MTDFPQNPQLLTDLNTFKGTYATATSGGLSEFKPVCSTQDNHSDCSDKMYCKWTGENCVDDNPLSNVTVSGDNTDELKKILLTSRRMLDINFHKNDIKNKKIYTMFVFIIIIVLVMTIIHFKNTK